LLGGSTQSWQFDDVRAKGAEFVCLIHARLLSCSGDNNSLSEERTLPYQFLVVAQRTTSPNTATAGASKFFPANFLGNIRKRACERFLLARGGPTNHCHRQIARTPCFSMFACDGS